MTIYSLKAYGPDGFLSIVLKNCASELAHCLVKLFLLCLFISSYPSYWKFVHIQPVLKKGDPSNPFIYLPIALIFFLSDTFDSVFNNNIMRHLSANNFLSNCQYGLRKGRSTGDLLAFLTESFSSSFRDFCETFAVGLDVSKVFDRVWHKSLISTLPSYGLYPSLSTFIFSFLSHRCIASEVDGHYFLLKQSTAVFFRILSYHPLSFYYSSMIS